MAAIEAAADQLIQGSVPASDVIASLKQTYTTLDSISWAMSMVRSAVTKRGHAAPDAFRLSDGETLTLKRKREQAVIKKNENIIVVPDFAALLRTATATLQDATPQTSFARLVLALLLVSGRRLTEICSPWTDFMPTAIGTHYTFFRGALKKRGADPVLTIPLLVPFSLFVHGLRVLRAKQPRDVLQMTNKQVKQRHQPACQRDLATRCALPGAPPGIHVHDLRSTYLAAVYLMYRCPHTLARTGMHVLGHETLREHLSYNNVRLEGVLDELRGSLGALYVPDPR